MSINQQPIEKENNLDHKVMISISETEILNEFNSKILEAQMAARIPGYRPGKAPEVLIRQKFGPSVRQDVEQDLINQKVKDIIQDLNLVTEPKIEDFNRKENESISFTLLFEVFPEFSIPDLKGISIEKPLLADIPQEEIEKELKSIVERNVTYEIVDSKSKKDSAITIDLKGQIEGGITFPAKPLNQVMFRLDKDLFLSDKFNKELTGKKAQDELEFTIEYPSSFENSNIAGKKVSYQVKIHSVHKAVEPTLDDAFATNFGYESLEAFKSAISKDIEARYKGQIDILLSMRLFDKLEGVLSFPVPKSIQEKEVDGILKQMIKFQAEDESLKDKTQEELKVYAIKFAKRRIRVGLLLNKYAQQNNIDVTQEDLNRVFMRHVSSLSDSMQQQMVDWYFSNPGRIKSDFGGEALEHRVVHDIINNCIELVEKTYTLNEITQLIEDETEKNMY